MLTTGPTFFFDFADPGSYLASWVIDQADAAAGLDWRGIEVRPFPGPPLDVREPGWAEYQRRMSAYAEALGVSMTEPAAGPWTRKAHELAEFARGRRRYAEVRRAVFRAHFVDGADIGRVDCLAEIGRDGGLDAAEVRAALGVDAFADAVASNRAAAEEQGVREVPVLAGGGEVGRLAGFRSPSEIVGWIRDAARASRARE